MSKFPQGRMTCEEKRAAEARMTNQRIRQLILQMAIVLSDAVTMKQQIAALVEQVAALVEKKSCQHEGIARNKDACRTPPRPTNTRERGRLTLITRRSREIFVSARNGTHASIHTRPHSDYHVAHSDHSQWYMKMTIYRIYSLSRHDRSLIIEAVLYSIHTRVGFHTRRVLLCSFPLLRCEVVGA